MSKGFSGGFADGLKTARSVDEQGQPLNRLFHAKRLVDRAVDELLGICKGCLADGTVNQAEAEFLLAWIDTHAQARDTWPVNVLSVRLHEYLADGKLDEHEALELFDLLRQCTGLPTCAPLAEDLSTSLPFDQPYPQLTFPGQRFCLTGKFVTGTRASCSQQILALGGLVEGTVTHGTRYLVIGEIGSRDWAHSTHGRKIEMAVELRAAGHLLSIVPEQHWAEQLLALHAAEDSPQAT